MDKRLVSFLTIVVLVSPFLLTVNLVRAEADSWTIIASPPATNSPIGSVVVNGKIYLFESGGINQEFDPATGSWITKASMPTPRTEFALAAYQNKIYAVGGRDSSGPYFYNVTEVYDPSTDTWAEKAPMPINEVQMTANVVNGKIYLTSGKQYVVVVSGEQFYLYTPSDTEVYDPSTDNWTSAAPMPIQVCFYASAVVDGKIYVMGGLNISSSEDLVTATQIYDPATDKWSLGAAIPTPVVSAGAGTTTGVNAPKRIYVIGGNPTKTTYSGTIFNQVYDPETNSWTTETPMPNRSQLELGSTAVAVINDTLYAVIGMWEFTYPSHPWSGTTTYSFAGQYTPFGFEGAPLPSAPATPSPSPSQSPAPTPSPSPSPSSSHSLPPLATPQPTQLPDSGASSALHVEYVAATAAAVAVIAVAAAYALRKGSSKGKKTP